MTDSHHFEITETSPHATLVAGNRNGFAFVHYAHVLEAPADEVWRIVGDLGNLESMGNFICDISIEGEAAGAVRKMRLDKELGGEWIIESIDEYDSRRRFYRYSFLDFGSLPWAAYDGLLGVYARGESRSNLYFESRELPLGVTHREAAEISISNITGYAERVAGMLCAKS
ncbi:SRPBCC family protein [Erythrobacter sp.]|uniref:SRPBCC family protein n=1 Tax=Erythrobacter sp. TaxID=1042 RepID=UPI001B0D93B1|nr:SRPBCC family protein [Erythrobacter sp.]MBO6527542.1 SRPBCC family protein [Erythrobacter sp.]MBO6530222.1 SRPBCC family protein [Erythrobacter sp.]